MATLAEIRAKLKEQEARSSGASTGGTSDNAIFPFWNIPENTTSVIRFLPDGDASNTYFWRERQMIRIDFNGVKGQPDSRKVTVNVPCNEMWGPVGSCPVLSEVRGWFKDPNLEELGRKYWKKKSYVFQGFVTENSLQEESVPENPIRRFIINPSIFKIIKGALMDTDFENIPTDYEAGTDFRLTKSQKGQYADYSTSTWARRERSLNSEERASIEKFGLFNLNDYLPKQPNDEELRVIQEMFEASVDGQLYDPERWGNFYRPSGVQIDTSNSAANNSAPKPAAKSVAQPPVRSAPTPDEDDEIPFEESAPKPSAPIVKPATSDAKPSAQDILAAIRARGSN
jgi:hypothetical protein